MLFRLLADAASEGEKTIISTLASASSSSGVIALGELTHYAGARRKARRRPTR